MSAKHPIISITGSSGADTTSVKRTFEQIFRRENVNAAYVEGDSFHRYDRLELRERMAAAAEQGNKHFSHFSPETNPGFRSRIAHHVDFPDYGEVELADISEIMLKQQNYAFSDDAREAFSRYITLRKQQPLFSNARSIRNALDRARLRQANRLVADLDRELSAKDIMTLEASDIQSSRVFQKAKG